MKFKASAESQKELDAYCQRHGGRPLKELLMSDEHGEEGARIMYKYMPKYARMAMKEDKYLEFYHKHKAMILNYIV